MFVLSELFLRTGITLDEFYEKPPKIRAFMFASVLAKLEREQEEKRGEVVLWRKQ